MQMQAPPTTLPPPPSGKASGASPNAFPNYNPRGPCSAARLQAAFDPLLEKAMALHSEAAGKEGIQKGLHELYAKLEAGELQGAVQEKLVRLATAVETRELHQASQVREEIVRTTTTGWVEGGTWQWVLKHLIAAAQDVAPTRAEGGAQETPPADLELSAEARHVIDTLGALLAGARNSADAKTCDDIAKRLEDLYASLRNGFVSASTCQQLLAFAEAADRKETKAAQSCLREIAKTDFQNTKAWLPAVKQLLR
mmetsp:Transcript_13310/g.27670  ORF Transcript_13310/g.27670 Transcript_13310/m.27670 type:complete len:254 (+) Transcript_13310:80-841(+)